MEPVLALPRAPGRERLLPAREHVLRVVRMHAERPALPHLLLEGRAGEAQPALVDERDQAVRVGRPHHRRGRVGQLAEARLGLAERLLHPAPLVDVRGGAHVADELAAGVARHSDLEHPAISTGRRVAQPVLAAELLAAAGGLLPQPQRLFAIVRMGARRERHAGVGLPAGEAQPALVDERDVALGIGHPHERGRRVGELAELRLAVTDEVLVPRPLHRGPEHARHRLQVAGVLGAELACFPAERLDHAELAAAGADGRGDRARAAQVTGQSRRVGRQHPSEHPLRQPRAGPRKHSLAVPGELEHRDVVDAELARNDRRAVHEQPVELRPGQRLLAERRQRALPARPCPQFLLLTVSAAPEHLACAARYSASPMGSP